MNLLILPHEGGEKNEDGGDVAQDPDTTNRWFGEVTAVTVIGFYLILLTPFMSLIMLHYKNII